MNKQLIDIKSYIFALIAFTISFIIFFNDTSEFFGSMAAAILTGALAWISYILMRWLILALKRE